MSYKRLGIILVAIHLLIVVVHSAAHLSLHIGMGVWQNGYILVVIIVLPIVSGYLLWKGARHGFLLLLLSMLGALLFGAYYHFVASGADNVSAVGHHLFRSWALTFQVSAVLLALTEAAGVIAGVAGLTKTGTGNREPKTVNRES